MATDPIRRIRAREHEIPLTFGVRDALTRLAGLPASLDAPYLNVSLDWTPEGADPGREPPPEPRPSERRTRRGEIGITRRPARGEFDREMGQIVTAHGPRGTAFDSLAADAERVAAFLDDELDPAARGVFIVACTAHNVFEHFAFALPMETRLGVSPVPALSSLARLVDDHPAYAVLLADQHQATLSKFRRAARGRSVWLESSDWPRKQQTGGWSQRRLQARAGERVAAFARGIAEATERTLDAANIDMLVVAGDAVITSALDAAFSPRVVDRIVGTIALDIQASEQEMIEATLPLVTQVERDRELAVARAVAEAVGANGLGAAGAPAVLQAVQAGQVATLVIADDYSKQGWADYERDMYGVGPVPETHPVGGDPADLVPVALEEELIRLAICTRAEIEFIHSSVPVDDTGEEGIPQPGSSPPRTEAAAVLDELGGVGALLRFALA